MFNFIKSFFKKNYIEEIKIDKEEEKDILIEDDFSYIIKHSNIEDKHLYVFVRIQGDLNFYNTKGKFEELTDFIEKYKSKGIDLYLDITNISYSNSEGLGMMYMWSDTISEYGGQTYLIGINPMLKNSFDEMSITGDFNFLDKSKLPAKILNLEIDVEKS